uniref:Uncharacterized protein n=1 Tax=Rhizophora mucronata TaxID=61149 RepID=A0A2P2JQA1_RHIMU
MTILPPLPYLSSSFHQFSASVSPPRSEGQNCIGCREPVPGERGRVQDLTAPTNNTRATDSLDSSGVRFNLRFSTSTLFDLCLKRCHASLSLSLSFRLKRHVV